MKKKTLGICIAVVSAFTGLFAVIAPKAEAKALGQCNLVVRFYKQGQFVSQQVYVGYSNDCGAWQSNMMQRINNLVNYNGSIMDSNAIY